MFNFLLHLYFLLNSFLIFLSADTFELIKTEAFCSTIKVQSSTEISTCKDYFFITDKNYLSDEDVEEEQLLESIPLSDCFLDCSFPDDSHEIQLQFQPQYFYRNIKYYLLYCCFKIPSI